MSYSRLHRQVKGKSPDAYFKFFPFSHCLQPQGQFLCFLLMQLFPNQPTCQSSKQPVHASYEPRTMNSVTDYVFTVPKCNSNTHLLHRADVACMGESSFALWNLEFHFFHEKHLELVGQNCIFLSGSDPNSGAGWLRSRWCSKHAGSNTSREEVQASTGANPAARPAQPSLSAKATPALPAVSRLDQVQPLPS